MIGVDEVGRGCWAGPLLVVAARQIGKLPRGLMDSKLLTKQQRERLFPRIVKSCELGEGWVSVAEIDAWGLTRATHVAIKRALQSLVMTSEDHIVIDGNVNYLQTKFCIPKDCYQLVQCKVEAVVDADDSHPIVSAASIYAKVTRDNFMANLAPQYPQYQFEKHVGYGTPTHRKAVLQHGVCDLHRRLFRPVRELA
jgi:ribonuclease HII